MKKTATNNAKTQVARMKRKQANAKRQGFGGVADDFKAEIKRVTWPDQPTVVKATILVLGIVILSTAFVAGVDIVFSKGFIWLKANI